jgi:DNA-binding NtrC family response regulator
MLNVLLVEDEALVALDLADRLAELGIRRTRMVARVQDARAALADDRPDVLITDIRLGWDNGVELVRWARAVHPTLPVVFINGSPHEV